MNNEFDMFDIDNIKDNKEMLRSMTEDGLIREFMKLVDSYMKVYDEYYKDDTRDAAQLKDLVDGILGISAVLEVYTRDGKIHPEYAIEKLDHTISTVTWVRNYFKAQIEDTDEE